MAATWLGWVVRTSTVDDSPRHRPQHPPDGHAPRPDLDVVGPENFPAAADARRHTGRKAVWFFYAGILFLFVIPALIALVLYARGLPVFAP